MVYMDTKLTEANRMYQLLADYQNKWIALDKENTKVISAADSVKELENNLESLNTSKSTHVMFVLPFNQYYSPYVY